MVMDNMSAKKKARLRAAAYATGSGLLKILAIYGVINDHQGDLILLGLSGLFDMALMNVKVGGQKLRHSRRRREAS